MGVIQAASVTQSDGLVVNVTDVAAGNNFFYFSMAEVGFRFVTLQNTVTAMTLTLEATNDTDVSGSSALADANKTWTDITLAILGVASDTTSGAWIIRTPLPFAKCRLKYVRSLATNSLAVRMTRST